MSGRALTWPTRQRLAAGIVGALIVSAAFFPIYIGGAALTGLRGHALHLYFDWELAIPFWAPAVLGYLSMFALFLVPPLQLEAPELFDLTRRLVVATLIGGAVFVCRPSEVGFAERTDAGIWQSLYDRIYAVDGRANAVPSFHVIYTTTILLALFEVAPRKLRIVWGTWMIIMCASTILTHRHHLADVASGLAIAFAVPALPRIRPRMTHSWPEAQP
jgi:hypothetical protein